MPANEKQVGGNHYQSAIQTWDYILSHDLGFLEGNVIKYITRHRKKHGMQDLEKALHYLNKLIEVEHDRLQHPHDRTEQLAKVVSQTMPQERPSGLRNVLENSGRSQVAHEFSTGYRPTCLGDII